MAEDKTTEDDFEEIPEEEWTDDFDEVPDFGNWDLVSFWGEEEDDDDE